MHKLLPTLGVFLLSFPFPTLRAAEIKLSGSLAYLPGWTVIVGQEEMCRNPLVHAHERVIECPSQRSGTVQPDGNATIEGDAGALSGWIAGGEKFLCRDPQANTHTNQIQCPASTLR